MVREEKFSRTEQAYKFMNKMEWRIYFFQVHKV